MIKTNITPELLGILNNTKLESAAKKIILKSIAKINKTYDGNKLNPP